MPSVRHMRCSFSFSRTFLAYAANFRPSVGKNSLFVVPLILMWRYNVAAATATTATTTTTAATTTTTPTTTTAATTTATTTTYYELLRPTYLPLPTTSYHILPLPTCLPACLPPCLPPYLPTTTTPAAAAGYGYCSFYKIRLLLLLLLLLLAATTTARTTTSMTLLLLLLLLPVLLPLLLPLLLLKWAIIGHKWELRLSGVCSGPTRENTYLHPHSLSKNCPATAVPNTTYRRQHRSNLS